MSQDQQRNRRGRPQKGKGSGGGGGGGGGGGKQPAKKAAGQGRGRGKGPQRGTAADPRRPFWENDAGEAKVRATLGKIRPAQDPTALVRSLGSPPLGRFGDNAPHYYAAVYEKAQQFAIAMATAGGILAEDDDEADPSVLGTVAVEG